MNSFHPLLARQIGKHLGDLEKLPPGVRAFVRDVDEAYREMASSHTLPQAIPDLFFRLDAEGRVLEYKKCPEADAFFSGAGFADKRLPEAPEGELGRKLREAVARVRTTGSLAAFGFSLKTGAGVEHYEARLVPLPKTEIFVVVRNNTEHVKTEQALRASEFFLQRSQAVANIGSYYLNALTGEWISSPALDELFGIDDRFPKNVEGWISLVHPEQRDEMLRYLREHVLAGRNRFDREYRIIRHNDQQERWIHGLGELEFDEQGRTIKMIGTLQDITHRKHYEQALHIKDWAIESSLGAKVLSDLSGHVTYVNPAFLRMWGYEKPDQVVGQAAEGFTENPEDATRIIAALKAQGELSGEFSMRRRDGSVFLADFKANMVRDRDGKPVCMMASAIDITERRRGETALRELKDRLAAMLNALPDLLFVLDRDGRILDYRASSLQQLYIPPERFLGKRVADVLPAEVAAKIGQAINEAFEAGICSGVTYSLPIAEGMRWFEMTAARQGGAQSEDARVIALARDITDRKHIEESLNRTLERFSLAMEAANDGLWDWRILANTPYFSPRYYTMLGYAPDEMPAGIETWESLLHPDDREAAKRTLEDCLEGSGDAFDTEFRMRCKSGSFVWIRSRGKVVQRDAQGRPIRLVGTHSDVTERREAQADLAQALNDLEIKVRERTEQLSLAKEEAEAASRAKSEFLAMMSHEIRTPLSGVIGVLRLIGREGLGPKQQRYIDMAGTSAETLLKVINDILDFSKVEAGKLDLENVTFDLHQVVENIVGVFQTRAAAKSLPLRVTVDPDVPRRLRGDSLRVGQVLMNLVGNALKFTEAGHVAIRVSVPHGTGEKTVVHWSVADTGIGIPAERQKNLFEPFYQVDSSTRRRYGGTGLGLGICRQLVSLMGGKIGFESETGKGSTFWFELPFERPSRPSGVFNAVSPVGVADEPATPALESGVRGLTRVLLAEDDEVNRELAREMIQTAGCVCECVSNGRSAVSAVLSGGYDLVFMDCMMPEMDGYEATRSIRAEEVRRAVGGKLHHTPIIALTANAMKGDRELCLAAGMDDYMSKPLEPDAVAGMIRLWFRRAGHTKASDFKTKETGAK